MKFIRYLSVMAMMNFAALAILAGVGNGATATAVVAANTPVAQVASMPPQAKPAAPAPITTPTPTPTPSVTPTPVPAPAPAPKVDNRCIITIEGVRYDVTAFRNQHSGGDIFTCGADMTKIFFSQHNRALLQGWMQSLRV